MNTIIEPLVNRQKKELFKKIILLLTAHGESFERSFF
jgi:hypothetical protein